MCDDNTLDDNEHALANALTRRKFGIISTTAAMATLLPPVASAMSTVESDVVIDTPDGKADGYFVHPASGKHPAVLIWPDIFGLRPAFRLMGKRLAETGYAVLVVNPYYRKLRAPVELPNLENKRAPENWELLRSLAGSLSPKTNATDATAFINYLDKQAAVDTGKKIGTTGYCMGGRLATDNETSPHLLIPQMTAGFLIAVAENDDKKEPQTKGILRDAFKSAKLSAEVEVYEGALHGWCPPDSPVYNLTAAERAWTRMLVLFEKNLAL